MKEAYVKPTVKSELLKAEVLNNNWGSGCPCCPPPGTGFWWWC